ncbi:hypothetical protein LCGC14_2280770 [marine sediment metagenome]|uniref:Uncharacterized protein n=1 Tax=marine sediment metagenome TaxID=412755 RepID=A0A0F9FPE7_9ZZZZ
MRQVTHKDEMGRLWAVLIPDDAPDSESNRGMVIGPPPLDSLGLPLDAEIRLHNQLFHRGILAERDVDLMAITSAIIATFKIDAARVALLYTDSDILPGEDVT